MIHLHTSKIIADAYRPADPIDLDAAALAFAIDYETREFTRSTTLHDAMALAAFAHLPQTRPGRHGTGTDPYITHPFRNVLRLVRFGCTDEIVLAATALHDTVEDQADRIVAALGDCEPSRGVALAAIAQHFGSEVADVVNAVTNPASPRDLSPTAKNAAYRDHVAAVIQEPRVFLVKLSDFIDNAGSLDVLADEAKRLELRTKYAPLVPVFAETRTRLGNDLALSAPGSIRLDRELDQLAESLA
nr:HD domain-containing protein [Rhodococcus sp. (in: high G+C Gram-positive bacteria)]